MKPYTGSKLQEQIIDYAHIYGWTVAHFRPAMTKYGYRTPVSADGKGWPDLFLIKPPRIVVFECKSQYEKTSPEQDKWLELFKACIGDDCRVVKFSDWDEITKILTQ
jgi:hypothetical protein